MSDVLLSVSMFVLMVGMGITLTAEDFRRIALAPAATLLGTVLQLIAVPLVGLVLARAFELPGLLGVCLVLVASCPGGTLSNVYVHLGRANSALSVTLTATATLVTLFTLPVWVRMAGVWTGAGEAEISIPIIDTVAELGSLTVLPVLIGMAGRAHRPGVVRVERWLSYGGFVGITVGSILEAAAQPEIPVEAFRRTLTPAFLLAVFSVTLALGASAGFRMSSRDAVTIAVELTQKNLLIAIILGVRHLGFEAMIVVLTYGSFQTLIAILPLVSWRILASRGVLEGPPAVTGPETRT